MVASRKKRKTVTVKPSPVEGRLEQKKAPVVLNLESRMALSVEEAAQAASLSERYMWDLVKAGTLRTKRVGRRRIVPVDALKEFLQ
jgi:excisionase family DNA binding protein